MKEKMFKRHMYEYGPHFDETMAHKAVEKMKNEDGTHGEHWNVEQAVKLAEQYGVNMKDGFNKYDWYVALNMVYSDYYKVIVTLTGSNNPKAFVELAKAWLMDKDVEEGKMWYYYSFVICDKLRMCFEEEDYDEYDDDDEGFESKHRRGGRMRGRMRSDSMYRMNRRHHGVRDIYDDEDDLDYDENIYEIRRRRDRNQIII